MLEYAVPRYCEAKGKTEEELTAEDGKIIFDRVMKLISENTLCAIMLGQLFPEIHEISHDMCTAEDFGKKRNSNDYKNFINHWYHLRTEIGAMLSFENLSEYTECLDNEEADYRILRNAYYESLNEVDARIFTLCEAGYKQEEIAQMLGYKSQATVAKHLKSMRSQLDTFLDDSQAYFFDFSESMEYFGVLNLSVGRGRAKDCDYFCCSSAFAILQERESADYLSEES